MGYSFEISENAVIEDASAARRAFLEAPNLETLIERWVCAASNGIVLCPGLDDDRAEMTSVAVILQKDARDCGHGYIPLAEIPQHYRSIPIVQPSAADDECESGEEDAALDARDRLLGAVFDEALCATLVPGAQLPALALSYVLSGRGEATISPAEPDTIDCAELPVPNELVSVSLAFRDEKGRGFGEHLYGTFDPDHFPRLQGL